MHLTQRTELNLDKQSPADEPLLRVNDLRISFITRAGRIQAINDVSFEVKAGETFGLVGETGCGKSQTAMAVMRLTPDAGLIERGEIRLAGMNLTKNISREFKLIQKKHGRVKLKRNKSMLDRLSQEIDEIRGRDVSMIFQEPMTSLNPVYTVGRQVSETLLRHGVNQLADRILARHAATDEKLKEIIAAASHEELSQTKLREMLQRSGLEALEDQIWFILSRKDVGVPQKVRMISSLPRKVKPITVTFLTKLRKSNGVIPGEYRALNKLPLLKKWLIGTLEAEALEVSYELLSFVNMPNAENVLSQYPHELSGGMRQRVMIAMALATRPKLVIADEPTSALDVTVQAQILELLRQLKRQFNSAILFISHDIGVISEICDRVGVMYAGNLVEVARLDQLFTEAKHPYTQGLFASIPKYGEKRERLQIIEGTVPNLIDPPKGCRFRTRCNRVFEKCSQGPPWLQLDKDHAVLCWLYGDSDKHVDQ
jgi:peptide/nickel transport system ATP-binding protein